MRAMYKAFEKINEVVNTFKSCQNVNICNPVSKGIKFQFFGDSQNHLKPLEALQRPFVKHLKKSKKL